MKKILLIIPYLGKWPFWFEAYLISIAKNPTINWLFITDCGIPSNYPKNTKFIETTQDEFNVYINSFFKINIPLTPRKICDLRPAFGELFKKYIEGYDYWGYCDMDIIWGDIRSFISINDLQSYDIISSRKNNTSGHFTIFKNQTITNSLYKGLPHYNQKLKIPKLQRMDEDGLTEYIKNLLKSNLNPLIKIKWDEILCNQENGRDSHQEYYMDKWLWKEGKMLELKNKEPVNEVMYLHFINWKNTMKKCEVKYMDSPKQFYISYKRVHYQLHSNILKKLNSIKNFFYGYNVKMRKRKFKLKSKSLLKRIRKKLRF